jgi:diguanylate cyclase (GGDEF)-like protein
MLTKMIDSARRTGTPLALAMVDVDLFKQINDTHGHVVGDRVLLCTAQWLKSAVRHTDFVARYGGEEFAVVLMDADLPNAEGRLRQVLEDIAGRSYEYDAEGERRSVRFTVSCGVSQLAAYDTERDLIQRADQGLYEAKQRGRNRVVGKKASRLAKFLSRSN